MKYLKMILDFLHILKETALNYSEGKEYRAEKRLLKKRRSICKDCPYRTGLQCGECGCFIRLKTWFFVSECPKNKW